MEIQTSSESEALIEKRKQDFIDWVKKSSALIYVLLAVIIGIAVYIRTRPIPGLKDITTGTWTLGPDLDPFLFLRWAEYIVEHGKLMMIDTMRYVPLGYNTSGEMKLLAYLIAWFHQILSTLSISNSVTYSAIIFPVIAFALTLIAFFLFTQKIFEYEQKHIRYSIAIIATLLFALVPALLPRTIAGIPEKESIAFFFMFLTLYFFICAYEEKRILRKYLFSALSGFTIACMGLVWGGVGLVFIALVGTLLFAFLLGKLNDKHFLGMYGVWVLTLFAFTMPFSSRYALTNLISSVGTGSLIAFFFILVFHQLVFSRLEKNERTHMYFKRINLPRELISLIIVVILLSIIVSLIFGFGFIPNQIQKAIDNAVHPLSVSRFGLTVAENKQPFFVSDWRGSFGPIVQNIPLYFWLFFIGAVALFWLLIRELEKKEKMFLIGSYIIFIFALIFSKYAPDSILNGNNSTSLALYFGGMLFFLGCFAYVYIKRYRKQDFGIFQKFNFGLILYFVLLTLTIIAARGGVRLIMFLAAVSPVAVAFLTVKCVENALKEKEEMKKIGIGILACLIVLSTIYTGWIYYQSNAGSAQGYVPGVYQWQWQRAMSWVRENTTEQAVFAHWWDYGYWVQSIGKRATVLDGGNAIVYWDHLMGRYVLTEPDSQKSLSFLYTHNATHLLIDSTDIGKYTAFSSIGSDENYDRLSWISTFLQDEQQTQETRNGTLLVYAGGTAFDDDLIWKENGSEKIIPKEKGVVVGFLIEIKESVPQQPQGLFYESVGGQYVSHQLTLRYLYYHGKLIDFKTGVDAGVFVYPRIIVGNNGQARIAKEGALLYLSKRTVHSQLAQLYLFDQNSSYFKKANVEDDYFIKDVFRPQGALSPDEHFIFYQDFRGPITIWEIKYPANIQVNPEYLLQDYPNKELSIAKPGYY